ncbi:MAG: hypothetical protein CM15mP58_08860 [Burkholderiaceae bacterium]|nr:MAG: hypothetical protein CM15mP58_08860 [Burkholderiaceae bacterium]
MAEENASKSENRANAPSFNSESVLKRSLCGDPHMLQESFWITPRPNSNSKVDSRNRS